MLAITPGPNAILIIQNAVHERRLGIIAAMGVWLTGILWATVAMFGLGTLFTRVPESTQVMYVICGYYLLCLGIKFLRESFSSKAGLNFTAGKKQSPGRVFFSGILTSIINPKAIPYWMSIFTVTNAATMPLPAQCAAIVMMPSISFIWYTFLSCVIGSKTVQRNIENQLHWVDRLTGAVMLAFGAKLLSMFFMSLY